MPAAPLLVLACAIGLCANLVAASAPVQEYIVLTAGDHSSTAELLSSQWSALLADFSSNLTTSGRLLRGGKKQLKAPQVMSRDVFISPLTGSNDSYGSSANRVALVSMTADHLELIMQMDGVLDVQPNEAISLQQSEKPVSLNAPSWGLDRIDQAYGRDGFYNTVAIGKNVDIYIIDTGVDGTHPEFSGRVKTGTSVLGTSGQILPGNNDCNGHGTFCASVAAGNTFGVARGANIYPVQVMDCQGSGTIFGLITGIAWARDMASLNWRNNARRGVISMSLVCGANTMVDQAVESAVSQGVTVVSAAGNYETTACNYSPARVPVGITVGATSWDDSMLSFSNFGGCVDIFAPGDNIVGAWLNHGTNTLSGTSMATPHVAGTAALLYETNLDWTPAQISTQILASGVPLTPSCDLDCAGYISPNLFLQTPAATKRSIPTALSVPGSVLNDDFLYWLPELSLNPTQPVCVAFSVSVSGTSNGVAASGADIRVAAGSDWFPTLSGYQNSAPTCMNPEYFYVFGASSGGSQIYNMGGALSSGNGITLSTTPIPMYIIAQHAQSGGVYLEFGSGVVGTRSQTPLSTFTDASRNQPALSTLAFSTSSMFTLSITGIGNCGGGSGSFGTGGETTPTPTVPPTVQTGLIPNAYTFFQSSPTPNYFNLFNPTWYSPSSPGTCFLVQVSGKGGALAALASSKTAFGLNGPFSGLNVFVFSLGGGSKKKTFSLSYNGAVVKTVYAAPLSATNDWFKFQAVGGTVSLWRKTGATWSQLFSVPSSVSVPYLTLSGTGATTVMYQNMALC